MKPTPECLGNVEKMRRNESVVVVFPLVALQVHPEPGAGSEQPQTLLAGQLLFCAENPPLGHPWGQLYMEYLLEQG